jgi:hypothetical protein
MTVLHYSAADGSYAGAFDRAEDAPAGSVARPAPPPDARHVWSDAGWVPGPPSADAVTVERDRRLRGTATFGGHSFQADQPSLIRIAGAGSLAAAAVVAGAQPGDYRWYGGAEDFAWIAADNTPVPMDAQTMFLFAQAIAVREAAFIGAARALKDMAPIPADYTDNRYWPA